MVLRWFTVDPDLPIPARDAGVGIATTYRYLHEAIDVIAAQAPDLPEVLAAGRGQGWASECLDGTLIASTRSSTPSDLGRDVWYSGTHKRHGGNIQGLSGPDGYPEWVSPVGPGSTHDLTAARQRAQPAFYPAAAAGLPTLNDTDAGTGTGTGTGAGAGIGLIVPTKGHHLATDNLARNLLISSLRAPTPHPMTRPGQKTSLRTSLSAAHPRSPPREPTTRSPSRGISLQNARYPGGLDDQAAGRHR